MSPDSEKQHGPDDASSNSPNEKRADAETGRSANLRRTILDAALEVFARDGYEGASLQAIAELANSRHPTVLYHFTSKEMLWRATIDHAFGETAHDLQVIADTARDLEPLQTFKVMLRAVMRFAQQYPAHSSIIYYECQKQSARFEWLVDRHLGPLCLPVEKVASSAIEDGTMKRGPKGSFTMLLLGGMTTFFALRPLVRRLYGVDPCDDASALEHADWFMECIFKGVEIKKPSPTTKREKK